jgi:hypothetical protein
MTPSLLALYCNKRGGKCLSHIGTEGAIESRLPGIIVGNLTEPAEFREALDMIPAEDRKLREVPPLPQRERELDPFAEE